MCLKWNKHTGFPNNTLKKTSDDNKFVRFIFENFMRFL